MSKALTVKEAKEKRLALEEAIKELICKFEKETGLEVEDISFIRSPLCSAYETKDIIVVKVAVKL